MSELAKIEIFRSHSLDAKVVADRLASYMTSSRKIATSSQYTEQTMSFPIDTTD
jgi:hypothetical protein